MKKFLKRSLAICITAATMIVGMGNVSVSAYNNDYTSKASWSILIVPEAPNLPGQHRIYTCVIPAYSGGYRTECDDITGSNNRYVSVRSDVANFIITTTGLSNVYYSSLGGTITIKCSGVGAKIVAKGSVGYYI